MLDSLKDKNVYIAGPITGIEFFNAPAFFKAKMSLRPHVKGVLDPSMLPTTLRDHSAYMSICLPMVRASDAVVFLPGWRNSKGAILEFMEAKNFGIPCFDIEVFGKTKPKLHRITE